MAGQKSIPIPHWGAEAVGLDITADTMTEIQLVYFEIKKRLKALFVKTDWTKRINQAQYNTILKEVEDLNKELVLWILGNADFTEPMRKFLTLTYFPMQNAALMALQIEDKIRYMELFN